MTHEGREVFTIEPDWLQPAASDITVELALEKVGFGAPSSEPNQELAVHNFEGGFTLDAAALAPLLAFFNERFGGAEGFWLPGPVMTTRVLEVISPSLITVEKTGLFDEFQEGVPMHLCFEDDDGGLHCSRVELVSAAEAFDVVSLVTAVDAEVLGACAVRRLFCVRLAGGIDINHEGENLANCTLRFTELPHEYAAASSGLRPVFLYEFWQQATDRRRWRTRWTSHDVPVTHNGTWVPAPFAHGRRSSSMEPWKDALELDSFIFEGNPLLEMFPFPAQQEMRVTVTELNLATDEARVIFTGTVRTVSADGMRLKAKCASLGAFLDRLAPRFFFQPVCNHLLYGPGCKLNENAWRIDGVIQAVDGRQIVVHSDDAAEKPDNWFAFGRVRAQLGKWTQTRTVTRSTQLENGVRLYLAAAFDADVDGYACHAWAGCSLRVEECLGKFDNYANYGGFPLMPSQNPKLDSKALKNPETPSGGK